MGRKESSLWPAWESSRAMPAIPTWWATRGFQLPGASSWARTLSPRLSREPAGTFPTRRTSATRYGPAFNIGLRIASGWLGRHLWIGVCPSPIPATEAHALAEYGQQVISRINFARGRILPCSPSTPRSASDIYKGDRVTARFQADGDNLNNRLNIIDFGGLFSSNAIAPGRSFSLRLNTSF